MKLKYMTRIKNYFRRTIRNKIYSTLLIILGFMTAGVSGDATFFVLTLILGVPLFLSKKDWTL